jgi:hypothetical protein
MATLDRELDLRPDQRAAVAAVLESRQAEIDEVWFDTHTRLVAIGDSVVSEISAVLDSAQARRLREIADQLHRERAPR